MVQRKDKHKIFAVTLSAVSAFVCLCTACLLAWMGAMGISSLFLSAVLLFIWPMLLMFISKHVQMQVSQWICNLLDIDNTQRFNFIGL